MAERLAFGEYDQLHHFIAAGVWDAAPVETELLVQADTEYRTARTKPEMALVEIDRVMAAGVHFGCVLADAGYGLSAPFRQGLTARKLAWAVGIPRHLKVYAAGVQMTWPVAGRGRPRKRHVPDILSMAAEDMLADARCQNISWRTGTKGKRKARFAAVRVRIANGPLILFFPPCCCEAAMLEEGAPWRPPSRRDGFASRLTSN